MLLEFGMAFVDADMIDSPPHDAPRLASSLQEDGPTAAADVVIGAVPNEFVC